MTLMKTSLLNGIAVIIKMLTLLGINKILAIYVGPSGYAALGQFQNAVQMITTFASGAINTGVTKYTAEYHEDEEKQREVWRTAGTISFFGSLIASLLVISLSKELAGWFLKDESYSGVFVWLGITLPLFVFNTLLLAILNGKKEIHRYVAANIAGSLFSIIATGIMAIQYGLFGALVALCVYQSLALFATLLICKKAHWFKISNFLGGIHKPAAKNLAKFASMALTSAICVPASHIFVRNYLGETLGWDAAGYWEAMWRLSGAYLMLVTTTLSVYYLPRLSEIKNSGELKHEILSGYRLILPLVIMCGVAIYMLRDFIIRLLFSSDFMEMGVLFSWQIVGDIFKIGSWLLGYVLIARAMVGLFVFSEVLFSLLFFVLVVVLVDLVGLEGVSIAHAVNYFIYLGFVYFALRFKAVFR